jgi:hypothetical protein
MRLHPARGVVEFPGSTPYYPPGIMKVVLCLVITAFASAVAWPLDGPGADRRPVGFELSTEMLRFDTPTTELILGWQRDANALFQLGLDATTGALGLLGPGRQLERAAVLAAFTAAGLVVNQAFSLTAHDERHMETARSIGSSDVYLVRDSGEWMSLGQFFVEAFDFTMEPGLYFYFPPAGMTPAQEAYVAGAGLNTNMLIAEQVGRRIDEGSGRITDLSPYLLNKLWGIRYFLDTGPTSDAANYMDLLAAQGYTTVTQRNVIALHAASCLLSGGFLSLARGTWRFIMDGSSAVEPLGLSIGPVRVLWPEVTTWLNPQCVSLQCSVDALWGEDLRLLAGVDAPVLGNTTTPSEVTVGAGVRIRPVRLGAELTTSFSGTPFLLGTAEVALGERFSVGIEGFYGRGTTRREAREHPLGPGASAVLKASF